VLLSKQIEGLASDIQREATERPYVRALIPGLCEDRNFWQIMLEMLEIVLHKRGYLIVKRSIVEGVMDVPPSERKEAGI
jgi:hypothetical protein